MSESLFKSLMWLLALGFAAAFTILCVPPLIENPDILGAAMAGFVNPYASGYAIDAIMCWWVLAFWVIYEAKTTGIKHGWVAVMLGVVPGVATGFAAYLLIRMNQLPVSK
ncbi:DUF2834 domain-containing protein [Litorivivens sp.]|uniref:DUF2834 domain-containing protein n=1 Tax=Litorivivens sp. TaxID=2020868 RepID=UPI003567583D